jgi:hypothetical protein
MIYSTQDLLAQSKALTQRLESLAAIEHELQQHGALSLVEGLRSLLAAKLPPNYEQLCQLALKVCEHFGVVETPEEVFELRELARAGVALVESAKLVR